MLDEEWIKALADGRRVKFTNQELPGEVAFITAQRLKATKSFIRSYWPKQKARLGVKKSKVISRVSCQK